jgi:hypothetical protein
MTESAQMKANLLAFLGQHGRTTSLNEDDYAKLNVMIADLEAITPRIAGEVEEVVEGSWQTEFASFGIKHSMGKNQEHDSDLALQSFNRMPKVPVRVSNLIQEIDQATKAYNNVVTLTPPGGDLKANLVVSGTYRIDETDRKKFHINFYKVGFLMPEGCDAADLRNAFGLSPDQALSVDLPAAKLWSDITYVDQNLRINKGNFGGVYVLSRRQEKAVSI